MSHYLQKWTQNRSKSLLFKTGKLWLEEEAAGRKDKGSDFSGWYLQSTGNKSKMWKTGLQMAPKHKASEQEWKSSSEPKRKDGRHCASCLSASKEFHSVWLLRTLWAWAIGCTFAIPSLRLVDGWVQVSKRMCVVGGVREEGDSHNRRVNQADCQRL